MVNVLYAHKPHPVEPLGIGYLASSIERGGHNSKLMLTDREVDIAFNQVCKELENGKYHIFAQSNIFGSHRYAIDLSEKVKEKYPNIVSFLGGPAPTFIPKLINRGFDAICRYEGEYPFLEFCDALEQGEDVGNIRNLWVRENPDLYSTEIKRRKAILDQDNPNYKNESGYDSENKMFVNETRNLLSGKELDELPFPARNVLYEQEIYKNSPIKHYMGTRGCPFNCKYCHVHIQNVDNKGKGSVVRRRSLESIAEEILGYKKEYGSESDYDQSDVEGHSYSVKLAKQEAEILKGVSNNRHIHSRFDLFSRDEDIARYLAIAGVTGAHVAIEAGNKHIRKVVHGRNMSDEQILTGAEYLQKYGIKMMTQNILGAVGETKEHMIETMLINQKVNPTFASASIFQPFPGTSAVEHAYETGALPMGFEDELIDSFRTETMYNRSILIMDDEQKDWLEGFQKFFAIAVEEKWTPQKVDKTIETYSKGGSNQEELETMYRTHRAEKDEELYGVKLTDVVTKEK